jgi:hypothetical protein
MDGNKIAMLVKLAQRLGEDGLSDALTSTHG